MIDHKGRDTLAAYQPRWYIRIWWKGLHTHDTQFIILFWQDANNAYMDNWLFAGKVDCLSLSLINVHYVATHGLAADE